MTILEALKIGLETGRPIRRPLVKFKGSEGNIWFPAQQLKDELLAGPWISGLHKSVTRRPDHALDESDLFAEDWEVKPLPFKKLVFMSGHE